MTCKRTLKEHTNSVLSIAFNTDGLLASGCWDNTINLTCIYTKKFVKTALLTMKKRGLVNDVSELIMKKLGVIDNNWKLTECVI
jgi:WD40 repeat protein